jgi:type I restriction enzyme S subunit
MNKKLPAGWVEIPLTESFKSIAIQNNKILQSNYQNEGQYAIVDQGQGFIGGYSDDSSLVVPCELPVIVFGDHTKTIKFIDFDFVAGADGIKVLKPLPFVVPKFFYYTLMSFQLPDKGYNRHFRYLRETTIKIAPLAEQKRIVTEIDALLAHVHAAQAELEKIPALVKAFRQKVLAMAVSGELTRDFRANATSETVSKEFLGNFLLSIDAGKSFKCEERPPNSDEIGVLKVSAVTWGEFQELESKTCFDNTGFNKKYLVQKDDFLFSRANTIDLVGACVIVKNVNLQLMLSDKTLRFRFKKELNPRFALYFLKSPDGRHEIERLATGNQESMRNIGQEKIRRIQIPNFNWVEQTEIARRVEELFEWCDAMETAYNEGVEKLKIGPQSLFQKAFRGHSWHKMLPTNPHPCCYRASKRKKRDPLRLKS